MLDLVRCKMDPKPEVPLEQSGVDNLFIFLKAFFSKFDIKAAYFVYHNDQLISTKSKQAFFKAPISQTFFSTGEAAMTLKLCSSFLQMTCCVMISSKQFYAGNLKKTTIERRKAYVLMSDLSLLNEVYSTVSGLMILSRSHQFFNHP